MSDKKTIHDRLLIMKQTCIDLKEYIDYVNLHGGISKLDNLHEHAICDCINRLGDSIKVKELGFDEKLQKMWSGLRVITAHLYHKLDLSKIWVELPTETQALLHTIETKLK